MFPSLLFIHDLLLKICRRDIARTYPEHDFFKKKGGVGQESLFNVMKAYSIHDREVYHHLLIELNFYKLILLIGWLLPRQCIYCWAPSNGGNNQVNICMAGMAMLQF